MLDTNFSLLSQEEIDTLIEFLTESTSVLESEVLSQESIDKLISMMRFYVKKPSGNHNILGSVRAVSSVLNGSGVWTLETEENSRTGFIDVFATDGEQKDHLRGNHKIPRPADARVLRRSAVDVCVAYRI